VDGNQAPPELLADARVAAVETVVKGDATYASIAAASILAKCARDSYVDELCARHPQLVERYAIDANKGYGTERHLLGVNQHGVSQFHRKTFGICRDAKLNPV
jgi:ribonuclease HII